MTVLTVARYDATALPYPLRIDGELESLQKLVDGYIEVVHLPGGLVLVCNEEGMLRRLPVHHAVAIGDGRYMPIHGDFFVCRSEGSEFASISGEDIGKLAALIIPVRIR